MAIERVKFSPLAEGGDNVTAALVKLDENCQELADALGVDGTGPTLSDRVTAVEGAVDTLETTVGDLGNAATKNVGTAAGTVAAGDDIRFSMTAFRNKIINGDFRFWQSGTDLVGSTNSNSVVWGDRWLHQAFAGSGGSGTGVVRQQRQSLTVGQTDIPAQYSNRLFVQSLAAQGGTGAMIRAIQYIEDVNTFAGQVVAVSFWAKSDSNRNIVVSMQQIFGSGGSASTQTNATVAITSSWARYTAWLTIPGITGKTVGANSSILLGFYLYNQDTTGGVTPVGTWSASPAYLEYTCVQAETVSAVNRPATDFEYRPLGVEDTLVRRYSRPTSIFLNGRFGSSTAVRFFQHLSPVMRRVPDISFITPVLSLEATQVAIYSMNTPAVAIAGDNSQISIDLTGTITGGTPSAGAIAQLNTSSAFILRAEF